MAQTNVQTFVVFDTKSTKTSHGQLAYTQPQHYASHTRGSGEPGKPVGLGRFAPAEDDTKSRLGSPSLSWWSPRAGGLIALFEVVFEVMFDVVGVFEVVFVGAARGIDAC
ncbi:hypothetical protein A0H81_05813 [Grifola frondosa]|uniref:Uncharacterized protein n=1 Tax=Grifola frondosa TaxID=5627 RepID=A0A1C7ME90_GRIFR|nr:hypothetical protein A0H81_05813 [Grifola frondosa]